MIMVICCLPLCRCRRLFCFSVVSLSARAGQAKFQASVYTGYLSNLESVRAKYGLQRQAREA